MKRNARESDDVEPAKRCELKLDGPQREKLIKSVYEEKSMWTRHCDEENCTTMPIEGTKVGQLPEWISGTLYRVGPGVLCFGGECYEGALDGCAIIHAWKIDKGSATYQNRVLQSDTYQTNLAAKRIAVNEFFTVAQPDPCQTMLGNFQTQFLTLPDPKDQTDNCLINMILHGDELYATSETNTIRQINPDTLETIGPGTNHSDYIAVHSTTAHPHTDEKGTVFNLGSSVHMGKTQINVIEFPKPRENPNEKYMSAHDQAEIIVSLPVLSNVRPTYIHSFGFTENFFIFADHPFGINIPKAVVSRALATPTYKFIEYDPNGIVQFRIVDRSSNTELTTRKFYCAKAFASFHTINAYEDNGHIVFDLCCGNEPYYELLHFNNLAAEDAILPVTDALRFVIPVNVQSDAKRKPGDNLITLKDTSCKAILDKDGNVSLTGERLVSTKLEMPRINYRFNGKKYKYFYSVALMEGSKCDTYLLKTNVRTGETKKWFKQDFQVFEPVFIERPECRPEDEDDGVVVTPLLHKTDVHQVELLILDAKSFTELGRVVFSAKGPVTPTLHGMFKTMKV